MYYGHQICEFCSINKVSRLYLSHVTSSLFIRTNYWYFEKLLKNQIKGLCSHYPTLFSCRKCTKWFHINTQSVVLPQSYSMCIVNLNKLIGHVWIKFTSLEITAQVDYKYEICKPCSLGIIIYQWEHHLRQYCLTNDSSEILVWRRDIVDVYTSDGMLCSGTYEFVIQLSSVCMGTLCYILWWVYELSWWQCKTQWRNFCKKLFYSEFTRSLFYHLFFVKMIPKWKTFFMHNFNLLKKYECR